MATVKIQPVIGPATRAYLEKIGPVLKQAIEGAKNSDVIEPGVVVNGEWVMTPIGAAAEIRRVLTELRLI